jgi:hypothetical protein
VVNQYVGRYNDREEFEIAPGKALMVFEHLELVMVNLSILFCENYCLQYTAVVVWSLHIISVRISNNPFSKNFHQDVHVIEINLMSAA